MFVIAVILFVIKAVIYKISAMRQFISHDVPRGVVFAAYVLSPVVSIGCGIGVVLIPEDQVEVRGLFFAFQLFAIVIGVFTTHEETSKLRTAEREHTKEIRKRVQQR